MEVFETQSGRAASEWRISRSLISDVRPTTLTRQIPSAPGWRRLHSERGPRKGGNGCGVSFGSVTTRIPTDAPPTRAGDLRSETSGLVPRL